MYDKNYVRWTDKNYAVEKIERKEICLQWRIHPDRFYSFCDFFFILSQNKGRGSGRKNGEMEEQGMVK